MPNVQKSDDHAAQDPPVIFRPGSELGRLVAGLASGRGVTTNEAFKELAALAFAGLDVRYYDLVAELAEVLGGRNRFVRATLRVHDAFLAVARLDPTPWQEQRRARFAAETVKGLVEATGGRFRAEVAVALGASLGLRPTTAQDGRQGQDESEWVPTELNTLEEPPQLRITVQH